MKLVFLVVFASICATSAAQQRQNWADSADNWQNSTDNWQNSANNWRNSPDNWQNSADNANSDNAIYDNRGNRTGYAVEKSDGTGINLYDDLGNRTGYHNY